MVIKERNNLDILKKQGYRFVGSHGAVKICTWCRQSLINKNTCYKNKFYGIPSWACCQMSSWFACENKCKHCWRAIEINMGKIINKRKILSPNEIISGCIENQKKLLSGFGGNEKINRKRYAEAQEPKHFAISLIGEPTIYPRIGELISELRKRGKTTFLVTNGLHPEILKKLEKKKQLPTQLYISLNSSNEKNYLEWHNQTRKAWKKFNKSLEIMKKLGGKTRTVLRMTLVRGENIGEEQIQEYAGMIKKANPLFIEVKSFMSVGFSRKRLGYEKMPDWKEIQAFSKKLAKASGYIILGKHEFSRILLLGKRGGRKRMRIKPREV